MEQFQGRVWLLGDNLDTDVICPGRLLDAPIEEIAEHALESVRPEFRAEVRPGDVIVAGGNFGCGSSREQAPQVLKAMGISCVVAESFGRIFFRSAIAIGLPVLACKDVAGAFADGDTASIDVEKASVTNVAGGAVMSGERLSPEMLEIITRGGILELLKEKTGGAQ